MTAVYLASLCQLSLLPGRLPSWSYCLAEMVDNLDISGLLAFYDCPSILFDLFEKVSSLRYFA